MTVEATAEERIQRLERTVGQLVQAIEGLPADVLYRAPTAGEWPVMSTLAHLQEVLPYWAHQAEAIAAAPGSAFGRTAEDPRRIGAIDEHAHDSLDRMVARIRASLDECVRTLRGLPADAWQRAGQHPTRGTMSILQLVDAFLVSHAEEHAAQTQATLRTLSST